MVNDELFIVIAVIGVGFIIAAAIVATLPEWQEDPIEFLSDYFTRMRLAIILLIIGVILAAIGFIGFLS